jgi:hypothetical protein
MHHDASWDALPTPFIKATCKGQAWEGRKALFCMKIMEACEAKEHGHELKQRHQVEGPIMQVKEWMREFGWCNPWSTRSRKSQRKNKCAGEESCWEKRGGPRTVGAIDPTGKSHRSDRCGIGSSLLGFPLCVRVA